MCLHELHQLRRVRESVHTWVGTGSAFLWWRLCLGGREGCGMDTYGLGTPGYCLGRGGMEAPILGLSLGTSGWSGQGLSALSKLASTSTCLGLRVLGTCTLWSVPFPWPPEE